MGQFVTCLMAGCTWPMTIVSLASADNRSIFVSNLPSDPVCAACLGLGHAIHALWLRHQLQLVQRSSMTTLGKDEP